MRRTDKRNTVIYLDLCKSTSIYSKAVKYGVSIKFRYRINFNLFRILGKKKFVEVAKNNQIKWNTLGQRSKMKSGLGKFSP